MRSPLSYYATRFAAHGDTPQGAGWPNEPDRLRRFDVALDLVDLLAPTGRPVVCDLGCGAGELYRRLVQRGRAYGGYVGADALRPPLAAARAKFPEARFEQIDLAAADERALGRLSCDVLVANGLFTVKHDLSDAEMWAFMTGLLERVWPVVRRGIVFNVMSDVVDWKRDDLFHVPFDRMAAFLHALAGRTIGFRADYGLYEYMAYAAKAPLR